MFLRELGKSTERMNQPLPDGYMYIRRGTSFVYVYHNKTLLGKCDSLEEAREAIIQHSKGNCVFDSSQVPLGYTIKKLDPKVWEVWHQGRLMTVTTAKRWAQNWIANHREKQ